MKIYYNSIKENPSLVDGPGYRTVVFLQGCDLHCKNCQNQGTWSPESGHSVDVKDLAQLIREHSFNKKITISGGEPLLQKAALLELINELQGYNICLYTGHQIEDVSQEILNKIHYIKYGPFKESLKTSTMPFVGSSNQIFKAINHE